MSLSVVKAGINDTVQDGGRFGYQDLGINPSGAMDRVAMKIANALVGNSLEEAVLELCFPASTFVFNQPTLIALSGANFRATLNGKYLLCNQPVLVAAKSELKFTKKVEGAFCYLAVRGGFQLQSWLNSASANTKSKIAGLLGRSIQKNDEIHFKKPGYENDGIKIFPWRVNTTDLYSREGAIRCIPGNELNWLDKKSKDVLLKEGFKVTSQSDRMGFRLQGTALKQRQPNELVSTATTLGTLQVLPDGQLIVLMADHQTTGGYPRVAHVIGADLSMLTQIHYHESIYFTFIGLEAAEDALLIQDRLLQQIRWACTYRLQEFIKR